MTPCRHPSVDTWTFFEDAWHPGNHPIMGPRTHAAWLGTTVFDGARVFDGCAPDLEKHFERVNDSARAFLLEPCVAVAEWMALAHEGHRPLRAWTSRSTCGRCTGPSMERLAAACASTRRRPAGACASTRRRCRPLPASRSPYRRFRRPTNECAPVEAKAACLYPNGGRALIEAFHRGFGNCVMLDMLGNVAEFANSNIFIAKDGTVSTPVPNGTFLDGITRQRVIALARDGRRGRAPNDAALRRTSSRRTRSLPPAISPRWCRSPASRIANCWRWAPSTVRRASCIGSSLGRSRSERLPRHD